MKHDLKHLRELCDAATQGKWGWYQTNSTIGIDAKQEGRVATMGPALQSNRSEQGFANARFIAATDPTTVRGLIDEIERLRGALELVTTDVQWHDNSPTLKLIQQALQETEQGE